MNPPGRTNAGYVSCLPAVEAALDVLQAQPSLPQLSVLLIPSNVIMGPKRDMDIS